MFSFTLVSYLRFRRCFSTPFCQHFREREREAKKKSVSCRRVTKGLNSPIATRLNAFCLPSISTCESALLYLISQTLLPFFFSFFVSLKERGREGDERNNVTISLLMVTNLTVFDVLPLLPRFVGSAGYVIDQSGSPTL